MILFLHNRYRTTGGEERADRRTLGVGELAEHRHRAEGGGGGEAEEDPAEWHGGIVPTQVIRSDDDFLLVFGSVLTGCSLDCLCIR